MPDQAKPVLTVSIELFEVELAAFAQRVGAGPTKQIVLVLDQAGWHTSTYLRVPEHVHRLFLPPYSPERRSAEHLLGSEAADQPGLDQPAFRGP